MKVYFLYPKFLYLLLLIPLFFLLHFLSIYFYQKKSIVFSNFEAIKRVFGIEIFSKSLLVLILDVLVVFLLVFSLAGINVSYVAKTEEFSHVILIDNSRSMEVVENGISRLELAKKIAKNFVDSLPRGSEIAVVSFAGDVKIIKSLDSSNLKTRAGIDSVEISFVEGSNILNAVISTNSLLAGKKKAIFLISDGEFGLENLSSVLSFIELNSIVVNSVLVGKEGRDSLGVVHKSNEENLKAIALNSGGKFFDSNVKDFKEIVVEIEREVDLDLSVYCILLAILVFFICWIVRNFGLDFF